MNVDDLREWLEERLDKQDQERQALTAEVGKLSREIGEVRTAVSGNGEACKARHESNSKKIGVIRGILIALGLGITGTAAATLWARVFPDK